MNDEFEEYWTNKFVPNSMPEVLNMAFKEIAQDAWSAAAQKEREICEKLVMDIPNSKNDMFSDDCKATAWQCGVAIRNRFITNHKE